MPILHSQKPRGASAQRERLLESHGGADYTWQEIEKLMKSLIPVSVAGVILICAAGAQEAAPPLRKGVSVQMAVADHAVEMRGADAQQAIVVAITAGGKLFADAEPTDPAALSKLTAGTIYVKADSRVPYQKVLTVLDDLTR